MTLDNRDILFGRGTGEFNWWTAQPELVTQYAQRRLQLQIQLPNKVSKRCNMDAY
jgi:hypothetical protein